MSTHHPSFGRNSGIGSVFKSWTSSFKSTKDVPVQINPLVVGGGSDQQQLFLQLRSGTLPQRASTATKMIDSLEKFSISSIPEIWYLAKDMCDNRIQSYIRRVTLKLMIECIRHDDLNSTSNKLMYYQDIIKYCQLNENKIDSEFDLFLKALINLTTDGRDIQELVVFNETKSLIEFLVLALQVLGKQARNFPENEPEDDFYHKNLHELLKFLNECVKYNPGIIDEYILDDLIRKSIRIGMSTKNISILSDILDLFSTILVTATVQRPTLFDTIRFICSICGINEQLGQSAWTSISVLASQGTFFLVNDCLCDIITNDELKSFSSDLTVVTTGSSLEHSSSNISVNSSIGAIQIIEKLIIESSSIVNTHGDTAFVYFLPALRRMISYNIPVVNTTLLRTLDRLFGKHYNEVNKVNVIDRVYSFQLWYATKESIYELLNRLKLKSDIDVSYLQSICTSLQESFENHELQTPKEKLIGFFLHHYQYLPNTTIRFILKHYHDERSCTVLNPLWQDTCIKLLDYFYFAPPPKYANEISGPSIDIETKIEILRTLRSGFDVSISISKGDFNYGLILDILMKSISETDPQLLYYVIKEMFVRMVDKLSFEFLEKALDLVLPYFEIKSSGRLKSFVTYSSSQVSNDTKTNDITVSPEYQLQFTKGLCEVLLIQCSKSPQKASEAYRSCVLIGHYGLAIESSPILLTLFRTLVRIRASDEGCIYFSEPLDVQGLASAFNRNVNEQDFKPNESFTWAFPETIEYLNTKYFEKPARLRLFNPMSEKLVDDDFNIDISEYFSIVLNVMNNFIDWEVYSYIWCHFCTQLSNMRLFNSCTPQLIRLRQIVCDQLTLNFQKSFSFPDGFLKSHLQVVFVRSFSSLLCYHDKFTKHDEDEIIRSLLVGIDSWERTAIPCIHILTVCCYEIPLSIKKYLSTILSKFQTKITSTFASSHILEFLIALVNLPPLTSNFHVDDIRRIFAIAFKFIQHSKDSIKNRHHDEIESVTKSIKQSLIDETPSTNQAPSTNQTNEYTSILLQYVSSLSYTVIATWYLKIELKERKKLSSFMIKNLVSIASTEDRKLQEDGQDDQAIAFIDLVVRFTYSDVPLKIMNPNSVLSKFKAENPDAITCNWLIEYCLFSITTKPDSGESLIILRRPTGVIIYYINSSEEMIPIEEKFTDRQLFHPSHILLQDQHHLDVNSGSKPIPLMEDGITSRAISSLDRIPIVYFHKLGVIYIGRNQSYETQVLGNRGGSKPYQNFINGMGRLIKLKDCKTIYVGGLDIENDTDGKYGLYWNDSTVQVIFHTTTLMPNNERDKYFDLKKRHIGNNYVNIYFDESGLPFNFNIIKSQFNFINIVISPHSKSFEVVGEEHLGKKFYRVKTFTRYGVPGVFATCHFKIVSEELLANFVRNLAMNANQFANVWHASTTGRFISNWGHRVQQLRVLKTRTIKSHESLKQEQNDQESRNGLNDATQSFLEQLQFTSSTDITESIGRYEYLNETDHPLYKVLEFNSYT